MKLLLLLLCDELCVIQAVHGALLPGFDPVKYERNFNVTSVEILSILEEPVFSSSISKR